MNHVPNEHTIVPFVRELCAHKTEEEIRWAEDSFIEYIELALRVFERTECGANGEDSTNT